MIGPTGFGSLGPPRGNSDSLNCAVLALNDFHIGTIPKRIAQLLHFLSAHLLSRTNDPKTTRTQAKWLTRGRWRRRWGWHEMKMIFERPRPTDNTTQDALLDGGLEVLDVPPLSFRGR